MFHQLGPAPSKVGMKRKRAVTTLHDHEVSNTSYRCWKKYVLWSQLYRDVIVGSIYGHMNLDHFLLHDTEELKEPREDDVRRPKKPGKKATVSCSAGHPNCEMEYPEREDEVKQFDEENPTFTASNAETYLHSLREAFSYLPSPVNLVNVDGEVNAEETQKYSKKIGGRWGERYILSLVGPSVVPNYFPTLRVVEYNTTGLFGTETDNGVDLGPAIQSESVEGSAEDGEFEVTKKKKQRDPTLPLPPSKTSPPGPAYSMQPFSWLGYTQYYANMTRINGRKPEKPEEESQQGHLELRDVAEDQEFRYEVEYNTRTDKVYNLKDMTVTSYLKLAGEIVDATLRDNNRDKDKTTALSEDGGDEVEEEVEGEDLESSKKKKKHDGPHQILKKDKIWHAFVTRAFVSTIKGKDFGTSN